MCHVLLEPKVNNTSANPEIFQERLSQNDLRLYLATAAMIVANLVFPFAVHQIPDGGRIFLPLFFFTLIAGWRFGAQVGILTALASPVANHFLTGMPPAAGLQDIILSSALLAALAAIVGSRSRKPTLALVALVVVVHQALVMIPQMMHAGLQPTLADLKLRLPGVLIQIFGGFSVLWLMGRYLPQSRHANRGK